MSTSTALIDHATERALLGALMALSDEKPGDARVAIERERLVAERFDLKEHAVIFSALSELVKSGHPANQITIWARIKAAPSGVTPIILAELEESSQFAHSIPAHADVVRGLALRRKIAIEARHALDRAHDMSMTPADALSKSAAQFAAITVGSGTVRTVREVADELLAELEQLEPGKDPVLRSGIVSLDAIIGGLQPTLTVIGAMPGVGKSALLATIAHRLAEAGSKVGIFSLEDEARWLAWRYVAHESKLCQFHIRTRRLEKHEYERLSSGFERIWKYGQNILVDDRNGLTPDELVQSARDMVLNYGCKAIIVDHLGELRLGNTRRDRYDLEVDAALADLRDLSKSRRLPVIVAAHLRRRDGLDEQTVPKLTDFANSSSIERKARVALGLSREADENGKAIDDRLIVTVLKQTNGRRNTQCTLKIEGLSAMVEECEL